MSKNYTPLSLGQRYQIEALKCTAIKQKEIALLPEVHPSTVGRKLRPNNSSKGSYNPSNAQLYANDCKADKPRHSRFDKTMKDFIEDKMKNWQWSPKQISGWCKANSIHMASHERIYQYFYDDKKTADFYIRHRPTQHKCSTKHSSPKGRRSSIPNRVSIPKRLEIVNQKQSVGY